jgi:putative membrane protein
MTGADPAETTEPVPDLDPSVLLAADRTLLAWIRTGLALMGFGFVLARFGLFLRELASVGHSTVPPHGAVSEWGGTALVLLGVLVNVLAAVQHVRFVRRYGRGEPQRPRVVSLGTILSLVLALLGVALAVYLIRVR